MLHKGVGIPGAHDQLHTDPVAGLALLQGFVVDTYTERGGWSAKIRSSSAALLAVEGNYGRPGGHAAVYLVRLGFGEDGVHVQIPLPVVTGDINAGDVGVHI